MIVGLLGILAGLVAILVIVLVAGVAVAGAFALRSKQDYDKGNVTIPGRSGSVPSSWGGSHDPEAVAHRRLVAAMAALRANQSFDDDGGLLDVRVELEQQALAIDQQLVSVAALAPALKAGPLAQCTDAISSIEQAVADLATRTTTDSLAAVHAALGEVRQRVQALDLANAELDAPSPPAATPAPAAATPAPAPDPAAAPPAPPPTEARPETSPPQTSPPQTSPPQTSPPQTSPPQTSPPQTSPPQS